MSDAAFSPELETSTIRILDRHYPACCLICPPYGEDDDPEYERMLGGPATPVVADHAYQAMIPCENGLLVAIEWMKNDPSTCTIGLDARSCSINKFPDQRDLYLPYFVALHEGRLVPLVRPRDGRGKVEWAGAEPDWAIEFIDRMAALPFEQPPGPQVRLITLQEAEDMWVKVRESRGISQ